MTTDMTFLLIIFNIWWYWHVLAFALWQWICSV